MLVPEIVCRYGYVDTRTGRVYSSWNVAFIPVYVTRTDTPITKALPPEMLKVKPVLRRFSTHTPLVTACHLHAYFGAYGQAVSLEKIWGKLNAGADLRRKMARHILALWEAGDSSILAQYHLDRLTELADFSDKASLVRALETMDEPKDQRVGEKIVRVFSYSDGKPLARLEGFIDESGAFVRDGAVATWLPDGERESVEHFRRGERTYSER